MDRMDEVLKKLEAIETLLQRLPEVYAAVFISMLEDWQKARMQGKGAADLWEIHSLNQR